MSSRLWQEIREKRGWAYEIYSFNQNELESGCFVVGGAVAPDKINDTIDLIQEEFTKLIIDGVTDKELQLAKNQLCGLYNRSGQYMRSRMMKIAKHEIYYGKYYTSSEIQSLINNVSGQDINKMTAHLFRNEYAVAIVGPNAN
jgi:predicted Zn-dependent peptidase